MQNIRQKLLTGSLIIILIGVVISSIFFISSLAPGSSKDEIVTFPSPNPNELSSPEISKSVSDTNVAGVQTSPSPTKKLLPTPTKAKISPTEVPASTSVPTETPTSTPSPTSVPQESTPTPDLTPTPSPTATPAPSPTP